MSVRMRWLAGFTVAVLCILSGFLGLTAGINLNPSSTVRFVPNWGSVGDWIAGIGALAAVVFALWSERRRRLEDAESLNVYQSFDAFKMEWSIQLVCTGKRPVRIDALKLSTPNHKTGTRFHADEFQSYALPVTLTYAESVELTMSHNVDHNLGLMLQRLAATDDLHRLKLIVVTTVKEYEFPLEGELIERLKVTKERNDRDLAALRERGLFGGPNVPG